MMYIIKRGHVTISAEGKVEFGDWEVNMENKADNVYVGIVNDAILALQSFLYKAEGDVQGQRDAQKSPTEVGLDCTTLGE